MSLSTDYANGKKEKENLLEMSTGRAPLVIEANQTKIASLPGVDMHANSSLHPKAMVYSIIQ